MCLWTLVNRTPAERREHDKRHVWPSRATFGHTATAATATMRRLINKINLLVGGGAV
jgi:hypothetical protein